MDVSGTYFPDREWRTSTPEEQGVDSQALAGMLEAIRRTNAPVHSFLLVRHGYLVAEAYAHPQRTDTRNDLFSVTKSFISTLVGIAIGEGSIKSVRQRVMDFFPDLQIPDNGLGTADMTVEHLLTLSSGHAADSQDDVYDSSDWARDFFSRPFSERPGAKFLYDSGASHLLSAILTRATGLSAEAFALERLFRPLGITDYAWDKTSEGLSFGGWGLRLTSADMAKFGYLILQKGVWNGKRVVSSEWIETATRRHISTDPEGKEPGYGYQWWMNEFGGFRADGYAGQCIVVLPELDMVVAFTCGMNGSEPYSTMRLMREFVLPAAKPAALPANAEAFERLRRLAGELAAPTPGEIPVLPRAAWRTSGKTYTMDGSDMRFSLDFSVEGECVLNLEQEGRSYALPVGLDGVYRVSEAAQAGLLPFPPKQTTALRGRWEGEDKFLLDWQFAGEPFRKEFRFTFDGDTVALVFSDYVESYPGPLKPNVEYKGEVLD